MRNIKLTIAYDGTCYAGWQVQNSPRPILRQAQDTSAKDTERSRSVAHGPQKKTIQEILEKTLQKILQEKIRVIGSGRTDAGVHAFSQVAHFKTCSVLTLENLRKALNSLLPRDISVKDVGLSESDFHARYSAKSKVYRYVIFNGSCPSVFLGRYVWSVAYKLDIKLMQEEAAVLTGSHDFKSFCASGSGAKNTVRTIRAISVKKSFGCSLLPLPENSRLIVINIEANGFLYNMVRNIVGTLVEIGRGRLEKGSMKKILFAKNRALAGPTAAAKGLFLVRVKY